MVETSVVPLRRASITCRSISSLSSYPVVPVRRSSLSASVSNGSTGPATSTRTPSLSDSLYQIEVTKVWAQKVGALQGSQLANAGLMEDPFIDEIPRALSDPRLRRIFPYRPGTRLTVRWSSGSWDTGGPALPSSSASASAGTRPLTPGSSHSSSRQITQDSPFLSPMDLPISFVDVQASTCQPQIGLGPVSLWTTVQVSGDVASLPFPGTSGLAPLDTVILLGFGSGRTSSNTFGKTFAKTDVTLGLASNLIFNHDRVALAYIGAESCFEILLPLGFHSLDAVRSALEILSRRPYDVGNWKTTQDPGSIVQLAAGLFCDSPRAAFCHMFFISATVHSQLVLPSIDQAIGIHTITSQNCLALHHMDHQLGWHISYGVDRAHFIRRIKKVIRQLRTGIRPGAIDNVKLYLVPAVGCYIQSVHVQSGSLPTSLRAGEAWNVPVLVSVPAMTPHPSFEAKKHESHSPIVQDLFARINGVLMDYTGEVTEPILTAHVEYQHSLLPASNVIHVKTHLTVVRS